MLVLGLAGGPRGSRTEQESRRDGTALSAGDLVVALETLLTNHQTNTP